MCAPGWATDAGRTGHTRRIRSHVRHGAVHARPLQVLRVSSVSSAVHSVIEQVEMVLPDGVHRAMVLATNVYHRTPEGWRMVAHHASPGSSPEADMLQAQKPRLH